MQHILLTGHRGFIGSNTLPELRSRAKLKLIEIDDYPLKTELRGVDTVLHLGAIAGMKPELDPWQYFLHNLQRTVELLRASRAASVKRFLFISSCSVTHGVRNLYDVSKLQSEQWCKTYRGLIPDVIILRLYNVYGRGRGKADDKSVIAKFANALKRGRPLVIHGDGSQSRDFIHVIDVVRAIKKATFSQGPLNREYEVGTGKVTSIKRLAKLMSELAGEELRINYEPVPFPQLHTAKCPRPLFVKNPTPLSTGLKGVLGS